MARNPGPSTPVGACMQNRLQAQLLLTGFLACALSLPGRTQNRFRFGPHWTEAERARVAHLRLASNLTGADLERIKVGNQAGILKVFARDQHTVKFLKGSTWSDVSGIDGVKWAPLSETDRESILTALPVNPGERTKLDQSLMRLYARLPHLQTIALLGVLARPGQSDSLSPAATRTTLSFLEHQLLADPEGKVRRQAALALAVVPVFEPAEVAVILKFMKQDQNGWDTFTAGTFFQLHRQDVVGLPNLERIKQAVAESGNPHSEDILRTLNNPPVDQPSLP